MEKLSPNRRRELKYFCLQYPEKKRKLRELSYLPAFDYNDMPSSNLISNPTANIAIRRAMLSGDTELIEQLALALSGEFYQDILKNVTEGTPWEYLDMPMSRSSFYNMRQEFFCRLSKSLDKSRR